MAEDGLVPIGELARRTGVATSALRYYERIGSLAPAERAGQRRHYPPSVAERVALIRLYQDARFTLEEIGRMLAARSQGRRGWGELAERKIAELDARIADAQRAKTPAGASAQPSRLSSTPSVASSGSQRSRARRSKGRPPASRSR